MSQFGQDNHVLHTIYKGKRNGFFVDIGAYDGKDMSNTLIMERDYEWTGICVECNPRYYKSLSECRTSKNYDCAIYNVDDAELEFIDDSVGGCSGFVETNSHTHILHEKIIKVKTKKLTTLLSEAGAPQFIDFLSIDTEGSELSILQEHDFDRYTFGYICVEHNFIEKNRTAIRELLESRGYIFYRENSVDDDYIHKSMIAEKKGVFYNSKNSACSIFESGKMVYEALKNNSETYTLDYSEDEMSSIPSIYEFVVYNQHYVTNNWITREMVEQYNRPIFCIVTEVSLINEDNPLIVTPDYFTNYIILDSTIKETDRFHGFGRPLEPFTVLQNKDPTSIPIIGSFGFATGGKEWHKIVESVQTDYDEAIIRFHIPMGDYVPQHESTIQEINNKCNAVITKPGIQLNITSDLMNKEDLIQWCSENTINCFFYYRHNIGYHHGLAAVTDQAISAERPILVTNDPTFRHIHSYLDIYPNIGIKEAIEKNQGGVLQMKRDWSSEQFCKKFENIISRK